MLDARTNPSALLVDSWVPRISARWSATTDAKCPHAPSSDDYNNWSIVQIKRELAQRKLRIDPKSRVKSAYVALLVDSDAAAAAAAERKLHVTTVSTEPIACHVESIDIQPVVTSRSAISSTRTSPERIPVQVVRPPRVLPATTAQHNPSTRSVTKTPSSHSSSQEIAIIADDDAEDEDPAHTVTVHDTRCTTLQKRPREQPCEITLWDSDPNATQQHAYLRHSLALKAAKVDLETRRLEMDAKRNEHDRELERVQLALAQEQLKQAKLSTQKIRIEWQVEQTLQKKRLRDAGVSEHDIAAIV